jgi:nitrate reductase (cytochrome), electron transfer subunit
MRRLIHLLAVSALVALATVARAAPPAAKPISDRELGLSKTSVFEVPSPPAWKAEVAAPGEKPLPPRANAVAPPVIPHAVSDFLPITPAQNMCVDCHVVAGPKQKGEPTPVPASHFVDLRRAPGTKGDKVAGARWYCQACHVARSDAPPAVGNTFKP